MTQIFIDLFPWDNIKSNKPFKTLRKKFRRSVFKKHGSCIEKIKYWFYKVCYGFKTSDYFYCKLYESLDCENNKLEKTSSWASVSIANDTLDYDDIFPLRRVPFEDTYIYIPNNCEKYLHQKYGDYMSLPEEKDRYNHSTLARKK